MSLKRLAAPALALALSAALSIAARPAAARSYSFGGSTYFLTETAQSWNSAEAEAVADGGHLTSITSMDENTFLTDTFGGKAPVWLGATDVADGARTEGYFWTNGDPFAYTNWHPGEPNNGGGGEDYVAFGWQHAAGYSADPSTWNDLAPQGTQGFGGASDGPYYGIVKVAAAPEPSQTAALGIGILGMMGLMLKARKRSSRAA